MNASIAPYDATTRLMARLSDVDSFDDDLSWILERLTERAGGQFGLIIRYIEGDPEACILARSVLEGTLSDDCALTVADALRNRTSAEHQGAQELLHERCIDGIDGSLRIMHLRFRLTHGVTLVAAVGRSATCLNIFHDMVARRLHPVLQRYLFLWWMHRRERRRAEALAAAMNQTEVALLLLDRRGLITFCNQQAERLVGEGDGLRRIGDSLGAGASADGFKLQAALQHAQLTNGQATGYRAPLVALRRPARRALLLWTQPLVRPAVDPDDAAIAVHVLDPEVSVVRQLEPVFRIYRFTPAEARLVSQLVSGASLNEAAIALKLGVPTARGYLKKVFAKTATHRQAELIQVMVASAVRADIGIDLALV